MAAYAYALVHGFDIGLVFLEAINELLGRRVELEAFVDSLVLFNVITKNSKKGGTEVADRFVGAQ